MDIRVSIGISIPSQCSIGIIVLVAVYLKDQWQEVKKIVEQGKVKGYISIPQV